MRSAGHVLWTYNCAEFLLLLSHNLLDDLECGFSVVSTNTGRALPPPGPSNSMNTRHAGTLASNITNKTISCCERQKVNEAACKERRARRCDPAKKPGCCCPVSRLPNSLDKKLLGARSTGSEPLKNTSTATSKLEALSRYTRRCWAVAVMQEGRSEAGVESNLKIRPWRHGM